jgi:uncharacterized protein YegP (UPF0339 family)
MGDARFEIRVKKTKVRHRTRWHVVLVANNGEILSTSESLNSLSAARNNIEAQKSLAPVAPVTFAQR